MKKMEGSESIDEAYRPLPCLYLAFTSIWFVSTFFWTFNTYKNRHFQVYSSSYITQLPLSFFFFAFVFYQLSMYLSACCYNLLSLVGHFYGLEQANKLQWTLAFVPLIKALQLTLSFLFWYSCFNLQTCSLWMSFGAYITGVLFQTASFVSFLLISHGYCIMCERLTVSERRTTAALGCAFYLTLVGYRASVPYSSILLLLNYSVSFYLIFHHIYRNLLVLREQLTFIEDEDVHLMHAAVYAKYVMFKKFQAAMQIIAVAETAICIDMSGSLENYWLRLLVRELAQLCIFLYIGWTFRSQDLAPHFSVMPTLKSKGQAKVPPVYSIEMDAATFKGFSSNEWHIGVYRNRGIKAKKISARVSKFTDLIQHVAANCLLHPLSAGRQQPDEISDNDLPTDRPEKLSRSASFREESGDEEEEVRWAQLLLLRRRIPVPARDGLRDSLTTASTSIRASTSRRLTRRLRCRRSRCSRLVEGLGLVLADWLALCWWRWVASFVIICKRIQNWAGLEEAHSVTGPKAQIRVPFFILLLPSRSASLENTQAAIEELKKKDYALFFCHIFGINFEIFPGGAFGGNRGARPVPPEKGVFPLDHMRLCDLEKKEYISCLKSAGHKSDKCRNFSKKYLECRMEKLVSFGKEKVAPVGIASCRAEGRNLMAKQDMSELGFGREGDVEASEEKKEGMIGISCRSMESNRGQNGIQLLLAAEQEAQRIVNAARAGGAFGGNRGARPVPPEKGVFPLDHMRLCDLEKKEYISCLKSAGHNSDKCRNFSKKYLECRMEKLGKEKVAPVGTASCRAEGRNLMAKQDMSELGFGREGDVEASEEKKEGNDRMESNRGQNGIQLLLAAEQEAQRIVNAARAAKLARLKQAKEEAEKEIAEFRAQMDAQFQRKVSESSGDSGANVKRLEKETEGKIHHLKKEAGRISQDVVQMLLRQVTTVKN
ncbi:hypothetical protein RHGRI_035315 [Rhododendron griersonianum]|uniref:CHCH domain-containing protein n=1 Tax=Rhododendron griersonianum TaxID=479676 RepID=A0AAV6I4N5_9ERIC|nr:hypothetical protein RHGRI_035315 [Rhododendron griersonianum]